MTTPRPSHDSTPPETTLGTALADMAKQWRAGANLPAEHFLDRFPNLRSDPNAVLDLIYQEVLLRTERGEKPQREEMIRRFPDCAAALGPIFEVHDALEAASDTESLLAKATYGTEQRQRVATSDASPRIPGYEVMEKLGQGGMGAVFRARQIQLARPVALKVVLAGSQAKPEQLTRLRREAEAIARLPHPNIVQIHEIGEYSNGPYLALEYVEGGGLDKKLAGTPLAAIDAARMVETLARAIHHAHQQGVIHRDLKPANILLSANGTPKVTDFGLARLGESLGDTRSGDILGTPSYMAPEQASGRSSDVGPATDIYSLGAILYELLTGRPPFRAENALETMRQVLEQEPVAPTRLQPKVSRDLETICLKCLQKDPRRRYVTAEELADDLRRMLEGNPIHARPVSVWERALKWAKRRPASAALVAVSLAGVLAIVVYSFWLLAALSDAKQQRSLAQSANVQLQAALDDAQRQRLTAQSINDFLLHDLLMQADTRKQADWNLHPNTDLRISDLLGRAANSIEGRFAERPVVEAGIRMTIGDAYRGIGEVAKSLEQLERAVELYRTHLGEDAGDTIVCTNNLATTYVLAGKVEQGIRLLEEAAKNSLAKLGSDDQRTFISLANLANTYQHLGKLDKAIPLLEEMLRKRQAKFGEAHVDTLTSMNNLAVAYADFGEVQRAIQMHEKTLQQRKVVIGENHPDTLVSMNNLAYAYSNVDRFDEAIAIYVESLEKRKTISGPDHPDTLNTMNNLASAYQSARRFGDAVPLFDETVQKLRRRFGDFHPQTLGAAANHASALHKSSAGDSAILGRAIQLYEETLEKQRKYSPNPRDSLTTMNNLASAYVDVGKLDRAAMLLEEGWEKLKASSGPDHPDTVKCLHNLALVTWKAGKFKRAIPLLRESMERIVAKSGPKHSDSLTAINNLAQAYFYANRPVDAEPLFARYLEYRRETSTTQPLGYAFTLNLLGDCRVQMGKFSEAIDPLREALAIYERFEPKGDLRFDTQSLLGAALSGVKQHVEAERHLLAGAEGLEAWEAATGARRNSLVTASIQRVAQFYEANGEPLKAASWRKKLEDRRKPKAPPEMS